MDNSNTTKKQHYVPKFYLKYFADRNGMLQILDIKNNRLSSPKFYSGLGYSNYFYAVETGVPDEVSQQVEHWLQQFENIIAKELPKIIDRIINNQHIDNSDRHTLSVFMSMLWLRSPGMRAQLNQMSEHATKQIMSFYVPQRVDQTIKKTGMKISEDERTEVIKAMEAGSYKLRFNNAQHLKLMTETLGFNGPGFANMFFGQKWKIYIARGKKRFITTDSPVVEWCPPPRTFYGSSFLERSKYFALTPEILFELTYPIGSKKMKRKTVFESDDDTIALFNILLTAHAHDFAYSGDKVPLEYLINGRVKPGITEKTYYEKFQRPWEEAKKAGQI